MLRASTVHLCPASWQPVSEQTLVLRGGYSGRSWSFSEALRSSLRDCSPAACCPPANVTEEQVTTLSCRTVISENAVWISSHRSPHASNHFSWCTEYFLPISCPFLIWCLWRGSKMPVNQIKHTYCMTWDVWSLNHFIIQDRIPTYIFHIDVGLCTRLHELYPIL